MNRWVKNFEAVYFVVGVEIEIKIEIVRTLLV